MISKLEKEENKWDQYVIDTYNAQIHYYWWSSRGNKKSYKYYRVLPIFLGAFLTFTSAIASTDYIINNEALRPIFAIGTPLLAVFLTIVNELSKISDWGADWRDKALTAQMLEKERDDYLLTEAGKRNPQKELEKLHRITINETKSFFQRTTNRNENVKRASEKPGE